MNIIKVEQLNRVVRSYKQSLYFKHPEYSVWKEAYDFYCILFNDESLKEDAESLALIIELNDILRSAYISGILTHLDSKWLSDEQKEKLTVYKKRLINDINYIEFTKSVNERVQLMVGGIIEYPLWVTYYTQYKDLRERAIKESYEGFDLLADKFGHALLDVDVIPLVPDEEGLIETYKSEIKKDLGTSKKYEDK